VDWRKTMSEISIELIKPSPYQPRMTFNLEDIKGSIMRDGISVPLTVRKVGDFYELIDGERRLRVAKEIGLKTVPITINNVSDEVARRLVWKVNTLRKDYTPKEKAYYFKKLQESGMSLRAIGRECDYAYHTVLAYLNVFKLPDNYQEMVWHGEIPLGAIQILESLFNGELYISPELNPQLFYHLDKSAKEKHYGQKEIGEALKPYLAKRRKEQIEAAKKVVEKLDLIVKSPETADELEKASKALKREAKRKRESKKTPEQKAEELEAKKIKKEQREKQRQIREQQRQEQITKIAEKKAKEIKVEEVKEQLLHNDLFLKEASEKHKQREAQKLFENVTGSKEPLDHNQGEVLLRQIEDVFYKVRGWGVPMMVVMGVERWRKAFPWIRAINKWSSFLLLLKPEFPVDMQPNKPQFKDIDIDESKIVEADYKIIGGV